MIWMDQLALFTALDYGALAVLVLGWLISTRIIEHPPARRPSVSMLMADYRRAWLHHFVTREPRIFNSQIIDNMRQGAAFFASASMIAIGGGLALIGNADMLRGVAQDLTLGTAPTIVWEIKLLLMLFFATNGFLKFVWSHRLFGYCAVLMAAVPNDVENPVAYIRGRKIRRNQHHRRAQLQQRLAVGLFRHCFGRLASGGLGAVHGGHFHAGGDPAAGILVRFACSVAGWQRSRGTHGRNTRS